MSDPKPATRDRLVQAAMDLFLKQGYAQTGVAQILKAADARSGSLYYHFPTKEDLLLAVLEWYRDNICPELLDPVFARVSDPVERVFGILDGYRQMLAMTEFELGCPIGNLSLELGHTHPAARELICANFTNWKDAVRGCFLDASDRLPESVDLDALAMFVLNTMEGAMMLSRAYRSLEPYDQAVTQLRDYIDRLIADGTDWTAPRRGQPE